MSDEVVAALVGTFAAVLASSIFTIWYDNQRRKDSKREEARRNAEQVVSLIARIVVQRDKVGGGKQIGAVYEVQQDGGTENNGFRVIGYLYDQLLKLKGSEFEEDVEPLVQHLHGWLTPGQGELHCDVLREGKAAIEAKLNRPEVGLAKLLK